MSSCKVEVVKTIALGVECMSWGLDSPHHLRTNVRLCRKGHFLRHQCGPKHGTVNKKIGMSFHSDTFSYKNRALGSIL